MTKEVYLYDFDCEKIDHFHALEARLIYQIGRIHYRWLGILLSSILVFPLISSSAEPTTIVFFIVGLVTFYYLAIWPLLQWLTVFLRKPLSYRVNIEINSSGVVWRIENQKEIVNPWLCFSGLTRTKHGLMLHFNSVNPILWIPIRAFSDEDNISCAEKYIQESVDRFRSMLK